MVCTPGAGVPQAQSYALSVKSQLGQLSGVGRFCEFPPDGVPHAQS